MLNYQREEFQLLSPLFHFFSLFYFIVLHCKHLQSNMWQLPLFMLLCHCLLPEHWCPAFGAFSSSGVILSVTGWLVFCFRCDEKINAELIVSIGPAERKRGKRDWKWLLISSGEEMGDLEISGERVNRRSDFYCAPEFSGEWRMEKRDIRRRSNWKTDPDLTIR